MNNLSPQRRFIGIALAVAGVLLLFHPQILAAIAGPLIRSDPFDDSAQHLLFLRSARNSDLAFAFAAEFMAEKPQHRMLVMNDYARRAETLRGAAFVCGYDDRDANRQRHRTGTH